LVVLATRYCIIGQLALAAAVSAVPCEVIAQTYSRRGSELTVYLITIGSGDESWEKFGHNAIWIHDALRNTDVAYNWGLFDFNAVDFYPRFLKGEMLYSMGGFDTEATFQMYREANRSIWVQELNLSPEQRFELRRFVEWNALPQNRFYHYDYYRDNCSTRVRDVLDRVLGGVIRRASQNAPTATTYRSHTRRLTQDTPWLYVGTLLGLGHPVDRPISRWEEMFLPVRLHDDIRGLRVRDSTGASAPLIKSERTVFTANRAPEPLEPTSHIPAYVIAGVLVAFVALLLRYVADGGSKGARAGLLLVTGVWNLVIGILGCGLAGLWLFTHHIYSYYNENLFQANPLSFLLAIMILASFRRHSALAVGEKTEMLAWIVAALAAIGFAIQILPWFNQVNGEIIGVILPAHIGIAVALGRRALRTSRDAARTAPAAAT
jgi:hypothetical protein